LQAGYVRLYGLPQLSLGQASATVNVRRVAVGVRISSFGWKAYRETAGAVAIGAAVGRVRTGFQLLVLRASFRSYGDRTYPTLGLGTSIALTPNWELSFVSRNLLPGQKEVSGRTSAVGLFWRWGRLAMLGLGLAKEPGFPLEWRAGLEYRPLRPLILRAGLTDPPGRICLGLGLAISSMVIHFSVVEHAELGTTQALSLEFLLGTRSTSRPVKESAAGLSGATRGRSSDAAEAANRVPEAMGQSVHW